MIHMVYFQLVAVVKVDIDELYYYKRKYMYVYVENLLFYEYELIRYKNLFEFIFLFS